MVSSVPLVDHQMIRKTSAEEMFTTTDFITTKIEPTTSINKALFTKYSRIPAVQNVKITDALVFKNDSETFEMLKTDNPRSSQINSSDNFISDHYQS